MSRWVGKGDLTPCHSKGRPSHNDPDLLLAMDLTYNLNARKQKKSSPFYPSSSKSFKSRTSERKDGSASSVRTRARKIRAYETEPFLLVSTLPDDRRTLSSGGQSRGPSAARGTSSCRVTPMSSVGIRQLSRFSMYSSPSIPTRQSITRGSHNRRTLSSSMSHKSSPNQGKVSTSNQHVKSPFKHSVHQPATPAPPERAASPSRDMKERTALATYHVNKVLSMEKQTSQQKTKGKLLKAKLKPLYPVQVNGPSMANCRGIVADTHQYTASASRTLQRRRQIMSSMNTGELHDLIERPRTVESIHRTSIASSIEGSRDNIMEEVKYQTELFSNTECQSPVTVQDDEDLNDIQEPQDFASGSPIMSREISEDNLDEYGRDTSTVFLTSGKNVEEVQEEEEEMQEKVLPELEDASREIIEMTEMLKKRISLIGIETGDLVEAETRESDVRLEESSETGSRSEGVAGENTELRQQETGKEDEDKQSVPSTPSEARVRPFSATTKLAQPLSPSKLVKRPLSTGDVTKRKVTGSKSVRFADETDSTKISQKDDTSEIKSPEKLNANNSCTVGSESHGNDRQSKGRCKPWENEQDKKHDHDPDDDKENYAPKKIPYFTSSQTFSQALASTDQTQNSTEKLDGGPTDGPEPGTRLSFMGEFLAHVAPIDDSVCSGGSDECLKDENIDNEISVKSFPLMSLSERIAGTVLEAKVPSGDVDHQSGASLKDIEDQAALNVVDEIESVTVENVPVNSDPAVNLTFSSHELITEFEEHFGNVQACKGKPPINKTRRKKSKSKGNSKRPDSPLRQERPGSPSRRPSRPNRNQKGERTPSMKSGKKIAHSSRYSAGTYGVEGRHHFPSDLIVTEGTQEEVKVKPRKAWHRPDSGHSVSSNNSRNSYSSRNRKRVPQLNFDKVIDDLEAMENFTYNDLDHQINLIQSELKRNIDQQEQLLNETETLRQTLRSSEGFTNRGGGDGQEDGVTIPSDSYYQELLVRYKEKCLEMGDSCLMISETITTPRWQQVEKQEGSCQDTGTELEGESSEKGETDVEQSGVGSAACEQSKVKRGEETEKCEDLVDPDLTTIDKQNFLQLLCTTVDEVEQPLEPVEQMELRPDPSPRETDLKVVATRKELSKEKLRQNGKPTAPFPPLCFAVNARPPQGSLYYFSYSDHMSKDRMSLFLRRDVTHRFWGLLMGFNLVFNKKGEDIEAGGFANIEFNPFCSVEGCVYQLQEEDLNILDKCVGVPQHYCRVVLPVWMCNSTDPDQVGVAQYCVPAVVYIAQDDWLYTDSTSPLSSEYSASQCVKSSDLLTPAYRSHLAKFTQSHPQIPPASA